MTDRHHLAIVAQRPLAGSAGDDEGLPTGARAELAAVLRDAAEAAIAEGLPVLTYQGYADAAIAAGWRAAPRAIIDPAGLAELPDGSVVLDALGAPRQLIDSRWAGTSSGAVPPQQVPLPATVLHIPE
jgi:hypothetical protein